ncbi:DNA phosphorothioation-dependent restriction protein DptG [Zunongwangia mangrovi]|uniref:DNA phosphorothioation-dependent restriction protein DptG n=2 Tax=Zunongwangia mangrovi TaxID=1334022 RepID=A0A1I1NB11_9FLAO|nr:DNA phosphorothioation-dependent restriction protein DptG [Zunongwangia mangrovi]
MKNSTLILMIFFCLKFYAQKNEPILSLTVTDPWLMVIGSDIPEFTLYDNGELIYKVQKRKKVKLRRVKLENDEITDWISFVENNGLDSLKENYDASYLTDQPYNRLLVNTDNLQKEISVYGYLNKNNQYEKTRKLTPSNFLKIYDRLSTYKNRKSKKWIPDFIEVMFWPYNHSPEKPKAWPENWPDFSNKRTVDRDGLYSVYLKKNHLKELNDFIESLGEKQAVEINGKKWSISYRYPLPHQY